MKTVVLKMKTFHDSGLLCPVGQTQKDLVFIFGLNKNVFQTNYRYSELVCAHQQAFKAYGRGAHTVVFIFKKERKKVFKMT